MRTNRRTLGSNQNSQISLPMSRSLCMLAQNNVSVLQRWDCFCCCLGEQDCTDAHIRGGLQAAWKLSELVYFRCMSIPMAVTLTGCLSWSSMHRTACTASVARLKCQKNTSTGQCQRGLVVQTTTWCKYLFPVLGSQMFSGPKNWASMQLSRNWSSINYESWSRDVCWIERAIIIQSHTKRTLRPWFLINDLICIYI